LEQLLMEIEMTVLVVKEVFQLAYRAATPKMMIEPATMFWKAPPSTYSGSAVVSLEHVS